jgi:CubicO group peptidase (beta-lactamase class C family)
MPRRTSSVPALLVTTLILVPGARHLVAQEGVPPAPPEVIRQVDSIFSRWDSQALPGCAVGVSSHEQTVLARAYGMADLEWGIPNSPETIFEGGSLSKQFTSAAIVLLALEGDLSLDDDVRTYIPELPDYGETITIRRLMNHTSGLRDWGSVAALTGWGREQKSHDHGDVLDILSRQTALNYPPGDRYSYTNSGYNLLAMIVDRVSGMPFAQFSEERIFGPLGLAHTQWRDDYRRLVPGRSTAYEVLRDGRVRINRPIEFVHGNGGILTTVGDLLIWDAAATDGRGLGGQAFVDMMEEQGVLNDGSRIVYASGIRLWTMGNLRVVSHTGSTAGYRAFLGRFPDQGLRVAMLCNASNAPTRPSGTAVALAFLADEVRLPQRVASVNVPEAELDRLTGLYRERLTGETREITLRRGTLWAGQRQELAALSDREFTPAETALSPGAETVRFVFDASGGTRPTLRVHSWETIEEVWDPVERVTPTADRLASYVGSYYSPDAAVTFVVSMEGGALTLFRGPDETWQMVPTYEDGFRAGGMTLRFHGEDGGVTGFSLSVERVYDMRFERVAG